MLLSPAILHSASLIVAAILTTNLEELLRRSDVGALAPDSFRARLALKSESPAARHEIEIWRSGEGKTLIRFLDSKERGKYLLRLQDRLWLLAPGARKPVPLNSSHRVYGGLRIDEVLGVRLAEHYAIEGSSEERDAEGTLVVLELRARSKGMLFPRVRYVVRARTERPVRAVYRLRSGREATTVDFLEWHEGDPPYARRVIVKDLIRNGLRTEVEILEMEERPVPDALFDLGNSAARLALER